MVTAGDGEAGMVTLGGGEPTSPATKVSPLAVMLLWDLIVSLGSTPCRAVLAHRAPPGGYVKVWLGDVARMEDKHCHLHVEMRSGAVSVTEKMWQELTPPPVAARHALQATDDVGAGPELGRFVWLIQHGDILARWGSTGEFARDVRRGLERISAVGEIA